MREERVEDLCRALSPVIGYKRADALRRLYYLEDDPSSRFEVLGLIEGLYACRVKVGIEKGNVLPPPPSELCKGDIPIGEIIYLGKKYSEFCLNLRDINRHVALLGATRSGKTTLAIRLIRELRMRGIKILILDWEKNYRGLADECPDFFVFTVGPGTAPFYHNPLALPPGIPAEEFSKSIVQIISKDFLGGYGSDTIMLQKIVACYREKGEPTFIDLYDIIEEEITEVRKTSDRVGGRRGLWKETVERIPQWLSVGYTSDVLLSKHHLPIEKLLELNAVLELGSIVSKIDRAFICHLVLNQYFFHKINSGILHDELKSVIVAEEAHQLFGIDRGGSGETMNMIGEMYRMIAKYGVGILAIDQTASLFNNEVFMNINTKISFVQNTKDDTLAMARAMNLSEDCFDYLGRLETGQAIVSVKQRIHEPFMISAYFKEPLKNISDEHLSGMMRKLSDLYDTNIHHDTDISSSIGSQRKENVPPPEKLSLHEKALLRDIARYPFDGVDFRTKRLSWHQTDMTRAHAGLSMKGFVDPINVSGKKLFGITTKGRDAAVKAGVEVPALPGRGGIAHGYGVHVAEVCLARHGFSPRLEHENIDLVDPDVGIAVEVETGKSDIFANLKKLASAKYKYRFMLGVDKVAETAIRQIVKPESGVKVMTIREFSKLTKEDLLFTAPQTRLP